MSLVELMLLAVLAAAVRAKGNTVATPKAAIAAVQRYARTHGIDVTRRRKTAVSAKPMVLEEIRRRYPYFDQEGVRARVRLSTPEAKLWVVSLSLPGISVGGDFTAVVEAGSGEVISHASGL